MMNNTDNQLATSNEELPSSAAIFTIAEPGQLYEAEAATLSSPQPSLNSTSVKFPIPHVEPLSCTERVQWARIHYLTVSNAIRLLVCLVCLCWFLVNAVSIFVEYYARDTIVYLDYKPPKTTRPPAISVCTSLLRFDKLADNVSVESLFTRDNLLNGTSHSNDVDIGCVYAPNTKTAPIKTHSCTELVPLVVSMQEGHKCWTLFSDIYNKSTQRFSENPELLLNFDYDPIISLFVAGNYLNRKPAESEAANYSDEVNIYATCHNPRLLPDLYSARFRQLNAREYVGVSFLKTVQILLPSPYRTQCYDYTRNKVNNETAGRIAMENAQLQDFSSRGHCIVDCLWRELNLNKCCNTYSIFTQEMVQKDKLYRCLKQMKRAASAESFNWTDSLLDADVDACSVKLCPRTDSSYRDYDKAKKKCLNECPDACQIESFEWTNWQTVGMVGPEAGPNVYAQVSMLWAINSVTFIEHRPKLTYAEFLAFLGGNCHIYTSVSVIFLISWSVKRVEKANLLPKMSIWHLIRWWRFWLPKKRCFTANSSNL